MQVAAHSKNKNREDEQRQPLFTYGYLHSKQRGGENRVAGGGCGEADLEGPQGREKWESKARGKEKAGVEATDLSPLSR